MENNRHLLDTTPPYIDDEPVYPVPPAFSASARSAARLSAQPVDAIPVEEWQRRDIREVFPHYDDPRYSFMGQTVKNFHTQYLLGKGYIFEEYIQVGQENEWNNRVCRVVRVSDNMPFAMKVTSLTYKWLTPQMNPELGPRTVEVAVRDLYNETRILRQLSHPNVIEVIESFGVPDASHSRECMFLCLVMEHMDGTLEALTDSLPGNRFDDAGAREWFRQIASAIDYLHNHINGFWISHNAVRLRNILYQEVGNTGARLYKLADFEECQVNRGRKRWEVLRLGRCLFESLFGRNRSDDWQKYLRYALTTYQTPEQFASLKTEPLTADQLLGTDPEMYDLVMGLSAAAHRVLLATLDIIDFLDIHIERILGMQFCQPF